VTQQRRRRNFVTFLLNDGTEFRRLVDDSCVGPVVPVAPTTESYFHLKPEVMKLLSFPALPVADSPVTTTWVQTVGGGGFGILSRAWGRIQNILFSS
jgi:hypothetical protein